ncbi:MAG: hypothetical protein O7G85_04785 [Planctomycetota bacterium]|nr:hypothetical protein [Planctomycetota bacterium]
MQIKSVSMSALMLAAILTGCESDPQSSLYANLSPELQGLHERPSDVKNNLAIVNNLNLRMYSDDWGRVFYTNNPSRLTPMPAFSLTGSPW